MRLRSMPLPEGKFLLVLDNAPDDIVETAQVGIRSAELGCAGMLIFSEEVDLA